MRLRVTWPDGRETRATIRTWQDLHRAVGTGDGRRREVTVVPDGDAFVVVVGRS